MGCGSAMFRRYLSESMEPVEPDLCHHDQLLGCRDDRDSEEADRIFEDRRAEQRERVRELS